MDTVQSSRLVRHCLFSFSLVIGLTAAVVAGEEKPTPDNSPGFSFDCDNTPNMPCRKLVASDGGKSVMIESSSAAWSKRFQKVIVVSDNFNDLAEQGVGHYVIAYFGLDADEAEIPVEPLLSPEQVEAFHLYDLEGVTLIGDRLYTIGSLALHGKNPKRDRWERHQFLQMDLEERDGRLRAVNLAHVTGRWPNFRDWLISKSGYEWSGEAVRGRAEGDGINVEALSATSDGNLLIGFRGPLMADGGTLVLEIRLPSTEDDEPVVVRDYMLPPLDAPHIPKGAPKTLRAITMDPGKSNEFYVLLGPNEVREDSGPYGKFDYDNDNESQGQGVGSYASAIKGKRVAHLPARTWTRSIQGGESRRDLPNDGRRQTVTRS